MRPSWVLAGCLACLSVSALACSEEPASDSTSPLALEVDSAPPTAALGVMKGQSFAAARDRKAREAFDRWAPLLTSGAIAKARVLCEAWLDQPDEGQYGEAHKCLANVEITSTRVQPNRYGRGEPKRGSPSQGLHRDPGAGAARVRSRISRARSNAAVAHYNAAIAAVPLDMDAHIGRVDILILAERYREANLALDESLGIFSSRAQLDKWFRLLGRFRRSRNIAEGLAFLKIIEKHHPLDPRVVSNLGAFYALAGNEEEALTYSERAVALDPDDPINEWNLALIYDHLGRLAEADRRYRQALAVFGDQDTEARCDYATFIGTRLGDAVKACQFAKANCKELFDQKCNALDQETGTAESPNASGNNARGQAPDPSAG